MVSMYKALKVGHQRVDGEICCELFILLIFFFFRRWYMKFGLNIVYFQRKWIRQG